MNENRHRIPEVYQLLDRVGRVSFAPAAQVKNVGKVHRVARGDQQGRGCPAPLPLPVGLSVPGAVGGGRERHRSVGERRYLFYHLATKKSN